MEGPVIAPGHGRHHGDGYGSTLMGPIVGDLPDAAGNVLQVIGKSASSGIHRLSGCGLRRGGFELATPGLKGRTLEARSWSNSRKG